MLSYTGIIEEFLKTQKRRQANTNQIQDYFATEYGRTLTPDQIESLCNIMSNVNYMGQRKIASNYTISEWRLNRKRMKSGVEEIFDIELEEKLSKKDKKFRNDKERISYDNR